jgi:hypothetical protein
MSDQYLAVVTLAVFVRIADACASSTMFRSRDGDATGPAPGVSAAFHALDAALSAAETAIDLCPICRQPWKVCDDCAPRPEGEW